METLPKISADLAAYEWHIWTALQWLCSDCGEYIEATADIRKEEEPHAPDGDWSWRKAREAMSAGWYVPPTQPAGSLSPLFCLCPKCAGKHGLTIQPPNA